MSADFVISQWGAWAPGLSCREDWQSWCSGLGPTESNRLEATVAVPKMLQRRLSPLARAVFTALGQCVGEDERLPTVFSSSHGELSRSLEMLEMIDAGDEISPAAFSLSVHNAISGLYSIAYRNRQEMSVIAPGREGMAAGFIEGLGLLNEGAEKVALVFYDEPVPSFYPIEPFRLDAGLLCALAMKIELKGRGMPLRLSRSLKSGNDGEHAVQLSAFIRFLLAEERSMIMGNQGHCWRWDKL
ncbi:MAG: beta-ketoacyl synthase chain length factor [Gammaproteobacteria bacterium]